jgi:hypothetical protein
MTIKEIYDWVIKQDFRATVTIDEVPFTTDMVKVNLPVIRIPKDGFVICLYNHPGSGSTDWWVEDAKGTSRFGKGTAAYEHALSSAKRVIRRMVRPVRETGHDFWGRD